MKNVVLVWLTALVSGAISGCSIPNDAPAVGPIGAQTGRPDAEQPPSSELAPTVRVGEHIAVAVGTPLHLTPPKRPTPFTSKPSPQQAWQFWRFEVVETQGPWLRVRNVEPTPDACTRSPRRSYGWGNTAWVHSNDLHPVVRRDTRRGDPDAALATVLTLRAGAPVRETGTQDTWRLLGYDDAATLSVAVALPPNAVGRSFQPSQWPEAPRDGSAIPGSLAPKDAHVMTTWTGDQLGIRDPPPEGSGASRIEIAGPCFRLSFWRDLDGSKFNRSVLGRPNHGDGRCAGSSSAPTVPAGTTVYWTDKSVAGVTRLDIGLCDGEMEEGPDRWRCQVDDTDVWTVLDTSGEPTRLCIAPSPSESGSSGVNRN